MQTDPISKITKEKKDKALVGFYLELLFDIVHLIWVWEFATSIA